MAIGIRHHNLPSETHNTYDVFFYDDTIFTTVTHDPIKVSEWIFDVKFSPRFGLQSLIVGLDVEWRPHTAHHHNPVATLQLCVGFRCLIYQIIHSPYVPQTLADFLSDGDCTFVGVGIKSDLDKLQNDHGIGGNARYVDLRWLAKEVYNRNELMRAGLRTLASLVLRREVEKPLQVTLSRWDNRWLTADQVQYACVDAYVSFDIGMSLMLRF